MTACEKCGHTHVAGDVKAVGRFSLFFDPIEYRTPDGALHPTRAAAQDHLCEQRRT